MQLSMQNHSLGRQWWIEPVTYMHLQVGLKDAGFRDSAAVMADSEYAAP